MFDKVFNQLYDHIFSLVIKLLANLPAFIENLFIFFFYLAIGYIVGRTFGTITKIILSKFIEIETIIKNYKLENALYGKSITNIIVYLVRWYFYIYFIVFGLNVSFQLNLFWIIPLLIKIYSAIGVFIFGLYISEFLKNIIESTTLNKKDIIISLEKFTVSYIFFVLALKEVGIDAEILLDILRYFAIAAAISFGIFLGIYLLMEYKDDIRRIIK